MATLKLSLDGSGDGVHKGKNAWQEPRVLVANANLLRKISEQIISIPSSTLNMALADGMNIITVCFVDNYNSFASNVTTQKRKKKTNCEGRRQHD